jgi:uncharacterized membrane protein YcaP (DUF421 family)
MSLAAVFFHPYAKIVFSSVTVYFFIVLAIRLFGKKELTQLSVVDLVFILLISNAVQNAMVGSNSTLTGGLVAAGSLFLVNYIFKYVIYRFPSLGRLVQGSPMLLIYKGQVQEHNLQKNQISLNELLEAVREHGVRSVAEVDLAVLEVDGNISILSHEFKRRTMRKRKAHRVVTRGSS